MDINDIEEHIIRMTGAEFAIYMFENKLYKRSLICPGTCGFVMKYEESGSYSEGKCWRCYSSSCTHYNVRKSLKTGSFFEDFRTDAKIIIRAILRIAGRQSQHSICTTLGITRPTFRKLTKKLTERMHARNNRMRKLGGTGTIVQIDETMLNYKCKSHRGRSPTNKTDAICIVQVAGGITKVWAQVISDKKVATIYPIICRRVLNGAVIHTDEHKSYAGLTNAGYIHDTVCHKYNFINPETGTHTQHVESFNNALKMEIKAQKGVKTSSRPDFLTCFIWKWNHKKKMFSALLKLIKI